MCDLGLKRIVMMLAAVFGLGASALLPNAAMAQNSKQQDVIRGERYVPSIWVDPDGCEHWVMDDGAEGYMTPHVNRKGHPICRRGKVCGVLETDQYFATDQYTISTDGKRRLQNFFKSSGSKGYIITGHTDSRASDEYNMRLSERRAKSVAIVGQSVGARIVEVRGYGERQPRASNDTAKGKRLNRRVEIICLN